MPSRERANTVRHWIQSAGDRLKRAETYDPGEDTTLNCEDAQQAVELALVAHRLRAGPGGPCVGLPAAAGRTGGASLLCGVQSTGSPFDSR